VKKILSLGILAIVLAVTAFAVSPVALAQTTTTPTEAQCAIGQARLTARITKVEAVKTAHTNIYTNIQTRLATLVDNATRTGYDTTALQAAVSNLNTKITTYADKSAAYSAALLAAKDTACTSTNAEFIAAIATARAALAEARTATAEVRSAFRGDVVKELKAYAEWLKENATAEEATE
jgi:hypothetical protein